MTVIVVADNFHQGRADSQELDQYFLALEYGDHIEGFVGQSRGNWDHWIQEIGLFRQPADDVYQDQV